jgi:sodium transport system ATP-binding protein
MIEAAGLRKSFRGAVALAGVSFLAHDGEVTGLLGPNGAGKSTTLRILSGLLRPDGGRALIDGLDVAGARLEAQARLGVLPDARGLYPRLTAREHVRYFGRLHGLGGAALEARIGRLTQRLAMADIADRPARGFSKGQTLKVALARALVHAPQNLLLDEPTNGLDVAGSRAVRDLVRELKAEGRCVILCSHVMAEVEALCDRLVVLSQGRVAAEGAPAELRRRTGAAALEDAFLAAVGGP